MHHVLKEALNRRGLMPAHPGTRLDEARATVAALREERRRLQRLGLENPLAHCHEELRYWEFVTGVLSLSDRTEGIGR